MIEKSLKMKGSREVTYRGGLLVEGELTSTLRAGAKLYININERGEKRREVVLTCLPSFHQRRSLLYELARISYR